MTFAPGGIVRIDGLQAQSHLNGCVGKLRNIDAETGRWVVDVKENGRTTAKLLKEANLHSPEAADGDVVANRVESFSRLRADFARTVENCEWARDFSRLFAEFRPMFILTQT